MASRKSAIMASGMVLLATSFPLPSPCWSADCSGKTIKRERNLLKQKGLYEEAIKQCPPSADLHYGYGFSQERLRKYKSALKQYETALKLDPQLAKALFSIGEIKRMQGDKRAAARYYRKGLQIDPDNSRILKKLWKIEQGEENQGSDKIIAP
ncbi:MAG: tetratricopeptide repeat protein [Thermodesulfobacteriota bacterium]